MQRNSLERYLQKKEQSAEDSVIAAEVRQGIEYAKEVLNASIALGSKEQGAMLDFDDMLYMPLWLDLDFYKYDSRLNASYTSLV